MMRSVNMYKINVDSQVHNVHYSTYVHTFTPSQKNVAQLHP